MDQPSSCKPFPHGIMKELTELLQLASPVVNLIANPLQINAKFLVNGTLNKIDQVHITLI